MPTDFGISPERNLVVGAGVTAETFGNRQSQLDNINQFNTTKGKKEATQVRFWQERIRIARRNIDMVHEDLGVERFVKEYKGEYNVVLGRMRVPPIGEVFSYTQSLLSLLINRDPYVSVVPNHEGSIRGAAILEEVLNYYWRQLRTKEEIEDELIDVVLAGSGFHKVGIVKKTQTGSYNTLRSNMEQFYSSRVSWRDMVWNIGARKVPQDCQWMAQRIILPTEEVKDKYGARAAGMKGGPHPSLTRTDVEQAVFKDDLNFSVLWEVWDRGSKEHFLLAENHGRYLREPKGWPEYLPEFPFQHLFFNRIPDQAIPLPDIQPFEAQILEKIKMIAMGLNHVKRWNRMALIRRGALRRSEMDKFERGADGTIIEVDGGAPADAIKALDYPPLQGDVYALLARLDEIINTTSGQPSSFQGGTDRSPTRTLGQLQLQQAGGQNRVQRKVDRIETHIENISRQLIAHYQKNFDIPTTMRITNLPEDKIVAAFSKEAALPGGGAPGKVEQPFAADAPPGVPPGIPVGIPPQPGIPGQPQGIPQGGAPPGGAPPGGGQPFAGLTLAGKGMTVTFSNEDIKGEYDIRVRSGSTLPLNRENRLQILSSVLKESAKLASQTQLPPFLQVVIAEILADLDIESLKVAFRVQNEKAKQQAQAQAQTQAIENQKTAAEGAKRKAQAEQVSVKTKLEGAESLMDAQERGMLPEAVEFGRAQGLLPSDEDFQE